MSGDKAALDQGFELNPIKSNDGDRKDDDEESAVVALKRGIRTNVFEQCTEKWIVGVSTCTYGI